MKGRKEKICAVVEYLIVKKKIQWDICFEQTDHDIK